ncbi:MAG: Quinone oxidoreductase-like protein [Parcubacteria group bacterium GW2011_GWA2_36_24]|nr:MAG: Quinone oxidoreductase-like protein [Parcubacteria group bacterium GW2011_GWA2_36_24]
MLTILVEKIGSIDDLKIKDLPVPKIKKDEILVKVKAIGLNPADWKGVENGIFEVPYILGSDISGVITEIGGDVIMYNIGDQIIGSLEWSKQGACAEYVITKEKFIAHKPTNLSFEESATIPLSSLTAWQGLFKHLDLKSGQKVFITAGTGGVGLFAIQLAKWKGAYVITTASENNKDFLLSFGVNEVIDYRNENSINNLKDIDCVFDSVIMREKLFKILKKGGKYVSINGRPTPEEVKDYDITAVHFLFESDSKDLSEIVDLIEKDKLKVVIDKRFDFKEIKNALEYQKTRHSRGKNVIVLS